MNRALVVPFVLLAACGPSQEDPQPSQEAQPALQQVYRSGRDGLCLADGRAGLTVYGPGNNNCSVSGSVERRSDSLVIAPPGDERCRIEVRLEGDRAILGPRSDQCAYYCGPGADYSGKVVRRSADAAPVTDFAGDPLC